MNSQITVYVCGDDKDAWARHFEEFFVGATTITALGTWEGETEGVYLVSHLFDKYDQDFDDSALVALVKEYKADQQQDAVLVTYTPVYGDLW